MLAPEFHDLLVHLHRVIFVLLLNLFQFRRERLHLLHRARALLRERPEDDLDENSHQDERHRVFAQLFRHDWANDGVDAVHDAQHDFGNRAEEAEIHDCVGAASYARQQFFLLRSGVKSELPFQRRIGSNGNSGQVEVSLDGVRFANHLRVRGDFLRAGWRQIDAMRGEGRAHRVGARRHEGHREELVV